MLLDVAITEGPARCAEYLLRGHGGTREPSPLLEPGAPNENCSGKIGWRGPVCQQLKLWLWTVMALSLLSLLCSVNEHYILLIQKKTFEVLSLLRPTGLATALWTFSSDGRLEAELVNQSFMKFGIQQKIRTTVTVMWWNIKSWRTVVVGKYSKCHNSPANVPTGTQLWWSHPIMFPILEMLWLPIGTTLGWRVVAFKQHVCCKTVSLVLI